MTCPVCNYPSPRGLLCSKSCRAEARRRTRLANEAAGPNARGCAGCHLRPPASPSSNLCGPCLMRKSVPSPFVQGPAWYPPAEVGTPLKPFVDELEEKK